MFYHEVNWELKGITQSETDIRKAALTSGKYRRGQRDKEQL